jgi:hypothetical protein
VRLRSLLSNAVSSRSWTHARRCTAPASSGTPVTVTELLPGSSHSPEGNVGIVLPVCRPCHSLATGGAVQPSHVASRILVISRHPRRCHAPLSRAASLLHLKAADKLTGVAASRQSDKLHPSEDETGARTRIKDLLFFV